MKSFLNYLTISSKGICIEGSEYRLPKNNIDVLETIQQVIGLPQHCKCPRLKINSAGAIQVSQVEVRTLILELL